MASKYVSFAQAVGAVAAWIADYYSERPHQAVKYRTPSEVRREALESTQSAA